MAIPFPTLRIPAADSPQARLYALWVWLVFAPLLAVLTAFFGTLALVLAPVSHRLAFWCGVAWARLLCRANFTRVRVVGGERARRGQAYVILCNHQSNFDVLAFYGAWTRQFRWVMKAELRHVPFLGPACAALRNVFVDRGDPAGAIRNLQAARPLLDAGVSLVLFPEGTRSPDGRLGPLKKGGFIVAMETGLPILPITISGTRGILPPHSRRLLPGEVVLRVHDPIPTAGLAPEDRDALVERVRLALAAG